MKNVKIFSFFLILIMATLGIRAQNGNAVISEVKAYDLGNGTGVITVRVSGNLASNYVGGSFTISSDRIPGGSAGSSIGIDSRAIVVSPAPGSGNGNSNGNQSVILTGAFPLLAPSGNPSDHATIDLRVRSSNNQYPEQRVFKSSPFYTVTVE